MLPAPQHVSLTVSGNIVLIDLGRGNEVSIEIESAKDGFYSPCILLLAVRNCRREDCGCRYVVNLAAFDPANLTNQGYCSKQCRWSAKDRRKKQAG